MTTLNAKDDHNERSKQNVWRTTLYLSLLCLRFACIFCPGYIHPDEFFQGGQELFFPSSSPRRQGQPLYTDVFDKTNDEVVRMENENNAYTPLLLGGTFRNIDETATWEYQREHAIRSIVPPTISTLIPLKLYSVISSMISTKPEDNQNDEITSDPHKWNETLKGWEIYTIPRIFLALLSILTVDFSIWYIVTLIHRQRNDDINSITGITCPPNEVLILASSWTALTFLVRPFSNTLETMCLSLLLLVSVYDIYSTNIQKERQTTSSEERQATTSNNNYFYVGAIGSPILIGILSSIGFFTRFTFAIFAFPIIIQVLHQRGRMASKILLIGVNQPRSDCGRVSSEQIEIESHINGVASYVTSIVYTLLWIGSSFIYCSIFILHLDSHFYNSFASCDNDDEDNNGNGDDLLFLTPWNALSYNSKIGNLSEHGLHPRITHAFVNMPLLYGPLAIIWFWSNLKNVKELQLLRPIRYLWQIWKPTTDDGDDNVNGQHKNDDYNNDNDLEMILYKTCHRVIWMGLGILSCAPHQEPRFLLPLTIPIILLSGYWITSEVFGSEVSFRYTTMIKTKKFCVVWIGFNLILMIFFGVFHQGSVIPSLMKLSKDLSLVTRTAINHEDVPSPDQLEGIIYYHTYMPMTFLLRDGKRGDDALYDIPVPVIDLKGSDLTSLTSQLNDVLGCTPLTRYYKNKSSRGQQQKQSSKEGSGSGFAYLVTPKAALLDSDESYKVRDDVDHTSWSSCPFSGKVKYQCKTIWQSFQISTEDLPPWCGDLEYFVSDMELVIYKVQC